MTKHEILQKINTFPIVADILAEELRAGDFSSIFKGQGIEADEVRRYQVGDDIRSIDWNVSARFGTPYIKMYREERELAVYICLDCSPSMHCGAPLTRFEQGLISAALLGFSAEKAGQRLGALFFDKVETFFLSARKGRHNSMNLINEALNQYRPAEGGTKDPLLGSNMKDALAGLSRGLKRRSLIVVISDFFCLNWEDELGRLCQKHDVIALRIVDPLARGLFSAGLIAMEDPETGVRIHAPTGFASFRSAWENWHRDRGSSWQARVRRAGAAPVDLYSDEDAATVLVRFFRSRRRKLK